MKWKCVIFGAFGQSAEIELPFKPFEGLRIRVPFRGMDFYRIRTIFWDDEKNQFHLYI